MIVDLFEKTIGCLCLLCIIAILIMIPDTAKKADLYANPDKYLKQGYTVYLDGEEIDGEKIDFEQYKVFIDDDSKSIYLTYQTPSNHTSFIPIPIHY